ncbi:ISAs1 family transposase [Tistrella bauzanensis]|uniref:ISAs1 family transposase n=1 Tax=Tistrella bauzanensis TaxID=657419 RepID=UPI003557A77A
MSEIATPRRKSLLEHFSTIKDDRQPCKVMYPLEEVLLLVVCGTMAACDDYDDIVLWGKQHLDFLRRLQPYHFGIPCADWLRVVMNRIGPDLFSSCFLGFVAERLPEAVGQIAIDGKTSRRSHDRGRGKAALHLVSAYATTHNLVLGQRAVADKSNEINAIPLLLEELAASGALAGSLVSIDAMGCQSDIAEKIVDLGGDYLLATKDNQKTAHAEIQLYFDTAPADEIDALILHDKGHGRIETRRHLVSQRVDWMSGSRRYPDEPRFKGLKTIAMIETRIETADEIKVERRCYISSRILSAEAFAHAARAHWAIENGLHWVLDVQFKEDQSRLRRGHGATNMAMVRHLALNLIRAIPGKLSIKARRKLATWDTQYLMAALQAR